MVQGSDDDEDWAQICRQQGLELVDETDIESESVRKGWISESKNEGSDNETVGEGSESDNEIVGEGSESESESGWTSDREKEKSENELDSDESSESSKHASNDSDNESESKSNSDKSSDTSKHASTDSDSEDENTEMTPKSVRVGNKITFEYRKCHFKCGSSGRVYSHMNKKHNMKKFECSHCNFSTPNRTSLLNHVHCYCKKNGHEEKKKLVTTKVTVKVDKRIKLPKRLLGTEVTFGCQNCKNFTGRSAGVVFTHMCDVHRIKPFSCRNCHFTSKNKTSMYNHQTRYCSKLGNKRSE